ncbi:MAG: cobyric acid synthase [Nitrosopumilaceae archaeon]|nr:cobyric acid synthase [Nitrosopumilaceae archaeon]
MPCIMVQGTMSGAGKSTLVTALCRILSDRGYDVAPFKSQNMSGYVSGGISRAQAVQAAAARLPPSGHMNPVLLVPRSDHTSEIFERGVSQGVMDTTAYYRYAAGRGIGAALESLELLRRTHRVVVLEGAGSPAEINVPFDMANMRMAEAASAPVIIVSDIERGGCFAQMAGTMSLLEPRHRQMVRGFIINKFRGDPSILGPGTARILETTGKPVLGVIPYTRTRLPPEDSLDGGDADLEDAVGQAAARWGIIPGKPDSDAPLEDAIRQTARTAAAALDSFLHPGLEEAIDHTARTVESALGIDAILDLLG